MLKNYLKIALRQLWKHKLFSALNIFGLATSMCVCLLIIMILADQYGYDKFHEKGDQIYRVISAKAENRAPEIPQMATTSLTVAEDLMKEYPFVKGTVRFLRIGAEVQIEEHAHEARSYMVDQNFLDIFSFGWTAGDKRTALLNPRSVVLTESTAKRFFPYKDPLGTTLALSKLGSYTVTGILPDPPIRSHIQFDYLISYATVNVFTKAEKKEANIYEEYSQIWRGLVYLLLDKNVPQNQLDNALANIAQTYSTRDKKEGYFFTSQALSDILPSRDLGNEIGIGTPSIVLYFLIVLGLIIIFCACFNYTNLSIARSLKRAKEIGVRKVIGARKQDIILQFIGEAIVLSIIALLVAIGLLELLIPAFYNLDPFIGQTINLMKTPAVYGVFLGFALVVGLVAGMLPAFNISKLSPIQAIQQVSNIKLFSKVGIQKVLITVQFALSLLLILTVTIVLKQQDHVLNADIGIRMNNLLNVRLGEVDYELFAQQVRQLPQVEEVSGSDLVLLTGENVSTMARLNNDQDSIILLYNSVSANYLENMDIELLAGKNLPETSNSKGEQFILLNELATKKMGFPTPEAAIGQAISLDTSQVKIIGVTSNFHQDDVWFRPVQPFGLRQHKEKIRNANIQLKGDDQSATLASIKAIWKDISPTEPLIAFYTDERAMHLTKFFKMGSRIISFVGFLTIIIACMGLLGMVIYTVEGRMKEVGIRKILGASERSIIWRLSKGFLWLLGIAILIATPLAVLGTSAWLQNFILRTTITPWVLLPGIGLLLFMGLSIVVFQTYWAARSNPIDSLRNE